MSRSTDTWLVRVAWTRTKVSWFGKERKSPPRKQSQGGSKTGSLSACRVGEPILSRPVRWRRSASPPPRWKTESKTETRIRFRGTHEHMLLLASAQPCTHVAVSPDLSLALPPQARSTASGAARRRATTPPETRTRTSRSRSSSPTTARCATGSRQGWRWRRVGVSGTSGFTATAGIRSGDDSNPGHG
jgi:hypothetical protein